MLTEEEITIIISTAMQGNIPSWQKDYFARIATNLQVHTRGLLFDKVVMLFKNENPDSRDHCINTYEPITTGSIWKGINNIARIFQNTSFNITASQTTLDYLKDTNIEGVGIIDKMLQEWINTAVADDPNSVLAIYPESYNNEYNVNPFKFIKSNFINSITKDFVCVISEDQSDITYSTVSSFNTGKQYFFDSDINGINGRCLPNQTYNMQVVPKVNKPVYHVFTKTALYVLSNIIGTKADWKEYPYSGSLDFIPVKNVGGLEIAKGIYNSFISAFVPWGNLALMQHRSHRAVDLMFSYPRMGEIETPCLKCTNGSVSCDTCPGGKTSCSNCHGTGFTIPQSPYKVYTRTFEPQGIGVGNEHLKYPPVEFYTPPIGILEYSKDSWGDYMRHGEEAIYVQQKVVTGNTESGKSKEIDRDNMYAWLMNISKAYYSLFEFATSCFEKSLNINAIKVSVEQPTSFAILTEAESFTALDTILQSPAPVFIKSNEIDSFMNKFVSKSSLIVQAVEVLKRVDSLLYYSHDEVAIFKATGIIDANLWGRHVFAFPAIMQLYSVTPELFKQDINVIEKAVNSKIDEMIIKQPSSGIKDTLTKLTYDPQAVS